MARPSKQINIEPWLKGLLSAGRRKAEDVLAAAIASGYATERSARTLRRVKAALGIVSEQDGEMWYWRDPALNRARESVLRQRTRPAAGGSRGPTTEDSPP